MQKNVFNHTKILSIITLCAVLLSVSVFAYSTSESFDPVLLQNLGFFAYEQGEKALAATLFSKALVVDESYEHARLDLAIVLHEIGDYKAASEQLRVLVELDENNVMYWYDLGVNLIAYFQITGDTKYLSEGITAYERAASIDEEYAYVRTNLAVLYSIRDEVLV